MVKKGHELHLPPAACSPLPWTNYKDILTYLLVKATRTLKLPLLGKGTVYSFLVGTVLSSGVFSFSLAEFVRPSEANLIPPWPSLGPPRDNPTCMLHVPFRQFM